MTEVGRVGQHEAIYPWMGITSSGPQLNKSLVGFLFRLNGHRIAPFQRRPGSGRRRESSGNITAASRGVRQVADPVIGSGGTQPRGYRFREMVQAATSWIAGTSTRVRLSRW